MTVQGVLTNAVKALTGEDVLVQGAGKQPMQADEFLRGTAVKAGARID